jgi:tripartite-type tricarboxylate transporter receptor subunit TctC
LNSSLALAAKPGWAQASFPNRTIRIIVPFPAGGTTDLLARVFAQRMTEGLGQSVVVENMGGGGGSIGADAVAKAAPDGYVLSIYASQPVASVVCEARRQQFSDEYGWRVRDVVVCFAG